MTCKLERVQERGLRAVCDEKQASYSQLLKRGRAANLDKQTFTGHLYSNLLYRHECLLENTPLVKFIPNHIRNSGGVFSISSQVKSLISGLSLKLYLNLLVSDRKIFGSSSKVCQSSVVFSKLRKNSDNV